MRAVICERFDGIDALRLGEMSDPEPGPGQVLVDVHAVALSFMDTLMVAGRYQMKPTLPFVPGTDAAGVVLAVGEGVADLQAGDRVACGAWHGAMAEQMVAPARAVVKLPDEVDFVVGSTVRYAYGTAYYALTCARLDAGETVFVSGAAGGVGLAAVELASRMGAKVIAGSSSTARGDLARAKGACEAIDYTRESVRERLLELTQGRGVDVFFDNVGGALFGVVSRAMAWNGRILPIGFASGEVPSLAMNLPLLKNYSVVGCFWGAWAEREPAASRAAEETIFYAIAQGRLVPEVAGVLPLQSFARGLRAISHRDVTGRLVVAMKTAAAALPHRTAAAGASGYSRTRPMRPAPKPPLSFGSADPSNEPHPC